MPSRVTTDGGGFVPRWDPLNPICTVPPAGTSPFHGAFVAVASAPVWVTVLLHACVTCCPAGKVQRRVQPRSARSVRIVRLAVKPVFHVFVTQVTEHPPAGVGVGDGVGVGVGVAVGDGVGVGVGVGYGIGVGVGVGVGHGVGAGPSRPKNRTAAVASTGRLCVVPCRVFASRGAWSPVPP